MEGRREVGGREGRWEVGGMEVGMGEHKERTHLQTADASADPDRRRRGGGGALEALRRRQQRSAGPVERTHRWSNGRNGQNGQNGQARALQFTEKRVKATGQTGRTGDGWQRLVKRAGTGRDWSNERERAVTGQTNQNGQTGRTGRIVRNGQRPATTGQTDRTSQTGPTGPYGRNLLAVPGPAPTRRQPPVVKRSKWSKPAVKTCSPCPDLRRRVGHLPPAGPAHQRQPHPLQRHLRRRRRPPIAPPFI